MSQNRTVRSEPFANTPFKYFSITYDYPLNVGDTFKVDKDIFDKSFKIHPDNYQSFGFANLLLICNYIFDNNPDSLKYEFRINKIIKVEVLN